MKPSLIVVVSLCAICITACNTPNLEPPGSKTSAVVDLKQQTVTYSNDVSHATWVKKINHPPPPIPLPYIYKEAKSGLMFFVESDGRHITAFNSKGKILWSKDPFADAKWEFYRTNTPKIVYIDGPRTDKAHAWIRRAMVRAGVPNYISITYNSSQFGCIDIRDGRLHYMGQN